MEDRVIIGAGIYGCLGALAYAEAGESVVLIERDAQLLNRATVSNQARLHTGLHYPRSKETAKDALNAYYVFKSRFPSVLMDFKHIYAVSSFDSLTTPEGLIQHANEIGLPFKEVGNELFIPGSVDLVVETFEPTINVTSLRHQLMGLLISMPNVKVVLGANVEKIDGKKVVTDTGDEYLANHSIVLAAYAGINPLRKSIGLDPVPIKYELCEVIVGTMPKQWSDIGVTVVDGPFWSTIPLAGTKEHGLAAVKSVPLATAYDVPDFPCQMESLSCSPPALDNCQTCPVRPKTQLHGHLDAMAKHVRAPLTPTRALYTVRGVLSHREYDDARPVIIHKDGPVVSVMAGKISGAVSVDWLNL